MVKPKIIFIQDYVVKVRSKQESLAFLKERLAQLRCEGKEKSKEGQCILAILRHPGCES